MTTSLDKLRIKLFADGADVARMSEMAARPHIKGFTTNPTLMRKAGVSDYRAFAKEVLNAIPDHPISFEVISDDFEEMAREAKEIASWGRNVYVKIPVTNTRGESSMPLVSMLCSEGIQVNVTALLTIEQVERTCEALKGGPPSLVSVFAGRIADTGRDPIPTMKRSLEILTGVPAAELIWASPRELLNIFQAEEIGCHVITATVDLLDKLELVGRDLNDFSLATVKMFFEDARASGLRL